jgi:HEAT repeat protein
MKFEDQLEQLRRLRHAEPGEAVDSALRKALKDRSNLIVAEAAKIAARHHRSSLIPDLLVAFDRLFENPVKADPKCWGKTAIVKSLASLEYAESPPFLRGSQHVQMEPVMGGQEDSATHLRANAILAIAACTDLSRPQILRHLVDALADKSDTVRVEAVRALEQMNGEEACLVLRSKAYSGDVRPLVLGQVFDSLLQLEGERAVPFVTSFMKMSDDEVRDEAALSLGGSRLPAAVKALLDAWDLSRLGEFGAVLLRALSSSRDGVALDFLLHLVREGSSRDSASALEALQVHKDSPEIRDRVEEAKRAKGY